MGKKNFKKLAPNYWLYALQIYALTNTINILMALVDVINNHLLERVQKSELTNENIISIIDNLGAYLNLMSISEYAKIEGITYNGVLDRIKSGKIKEYNLFGVKFVIDNY